MITIKKEDQQNQVIYTIPKVGNINGVIITVTAQKTNNGSLQYSVNYNYPVAPNEIPSYQDLTSAIEAGNTIET